MTSMLIRRYITLYEASSTFKSGRFANFYAEVKSEARAMFGWAEEEDAETLSPQCVREWIASHRSLFRRTKVTVYRAMALTQQQVAELKAGAELGQHWAFELIPDNFGNFDIGRNVTSVVVFTAEVTAKDVNFPMSVAYNCFFPDEHELFMQLNATLVIKSIRRYWFGNDEFAEEEERPDLIGTTMTV